MVIIPQGCLSVSVLSCAVLCYVSRPGLRAEYHGHLFLEKLLLTPQCQKEKEKKRKRKIYYRNIILQIITITHGLWSVFSLWQKCVLIHMVYGQTTGQCQLIGLHPVLLVRILILDMSACALHERLNSIGTAQGNPSSSQKATVFHRDLQCLADAGQSSIS